MLSADRRYDRTIPARQVPRSSSITVTDSMVYLRRSAVGQPIVGYSLSTGRRAWTVRAPSSPAGATVSGFDGGFALVAPPGGRTLAVWR